ncbi:hypothetical protein NXY01_15070 [Bacteroides fragilis]|nr:hypothetical protein NXY01_15070 [Bacteroides fragilis]
MKEITYNNQKKEIPDSPGGVIPQGVLPLPGVGINDECRGDFSFPDALQAAFLPSGDEAQPSSVPGRNTGRAFGATPRPWTDSSISPRRTG